MVFHVLKSGNEYLNAIKVFKSDSGTKNKFLYTETIYSSCIRMNMSIFVSDRYVYKLYC